MKKETNASSKYIVKRVIAVNYDISNNKTRKQQHKTLKKTPKISVERNSDPSYQPIPLMGKKPRDQQEGRLGVPHQDAVHQRGLVEESAWCPTFETQSAQFD